MKLSGPCKQQTNLNDDSSKDPVSFPHWSGESGELVMEMPLAKRVIGDHVLSIQYNIARLQLLYQDSR